MKEDEDIYMAVVEIVRLMVLKYSLYFDDIQPLKTHA